MSESLRIVYHNVLSDPGHEAQQIEYYHALQEAYSPQVLFLTEMREELVGELAPMRYLVDFNPAIKDKRHGWEGIAVVSNFKPNDVQIQRELSWKGNPVENGLRYDARELVRVEAPFDMGRIAIYGGRIFHAHHVHYPSFGATRPKQWSYLREKLSHEELSFAYLADTNTVLARNVRKNLQTDLTRARLLPHTGEKPQRTWRPIGTMTKVLSRLLDTDMPDILYLDRAAVSDDLLHRSRLESLPSTINAVKNPSDHRALLLTIRNDLQ